MSEDNEEPDWLAELAKGSEALRRQVEPIVQSAEQFVRDARRAKADSGPALPFAQRVALAVDAGMRELGLVVAPGLRSIASACWRSMISMRCSDSLSCLSNNSSRLRLIARSSPNCRSFSPSLEDWTWSISAWSLTSLDCLRKARIAKTAVTMAKAARTAVATAVSWVAKMSDMSEGYGDRWRLHGPSGYAEAWSAGAGVSSARVGGQVTVRRFLARVSYAAQDGDGLGSIARVHAHDGLPIIAGGVGQVRLGQFAEPCKVAGAGPVIGRVRGHRRHPVRSTRRLALATEGPERACSGT
jgi:hypothetical protein